MKASIPVFLMALVLTVGASCSRSSQQTATSEPVVKGVKVETVTSSAVDDFYQASGTVRAKTSSTISARVMGTIAAMKVREGDTVRVGQVLIEIDSREATIQSRKSRAGLHETDEALNEVERNIRAAEAGKAAAAANLQLAKATFNRYQKLLERQSVSPQEFDEVRARYEVASAEAERADRMLQAARAKRRQVEAQIDQAKADVATAQIYAGYARITSPINGIVVSKQADIGSMTTPGTPLLVIEDDSHYRLEVSVEESQIGKIHLGDKASVQIAAIGQKALAGSVEEIVPAAEPTSRSYTVKVGLPNVAGAQLRSGLYGQARFVAGQQKTITIPQAAISQRGQLTSVLTVDPSGVARLRLIKTGKTFGDRVEVLSGLSEGEEIVAESANNINEGTRVRETPPQKGQPIAAR